MRSESSANSWLSKWTGTRRSSKEWRIIMAVFNAYEATNPRLKKKPFNDGVTAGTAKVSSSRGGKSREELKALGERHGWSVRELSMREIQQMSADETLWQGEFKQENFDSAFTPAENRRLNREPMPVGNVRRML